KFSLRSKIEVCPQTSRGPKRGGENQPGNICEDSRSTRERDQPRRGRKHPSPTRPGQGDRGKDRISPGMAFNRRRPRNLRSAGGGNALRFYSTGKVVYGRTAGGRSFLLL